MDNDSTQQQLEQDQQIADLENQLSEAIAAENFFETASGRLLAQLISKRVNRSLILITSDKFLKDHMGFVNENSWLRANQRLLRELQVAGHPQRKAKIESRLAGYEQ